MASYGIPIQKEAGNYADILVVGEGPVGSTISALLAEHGYEFTVQPAHVAEISRSAAASLPVSDPAGGVESAPENNSTVCRTGSVPT